MNPVPTPGSGVTLNTPARGAWAMYAAARERGNRSMPCTTKNPGSVTGGGVGPTGAARNW